MDRIRNVTLDNPCPVCGGTDWCGFSDGNKNRKDYLFCHRERPAIGTVCNGYYCFKLSNQCSIWETVEQHEENMTNWGKDKTVQKMVMPAHTEKRKENQKIASLLTRHHTYTALLSLLRLENKDREYLYSEGWSDEMIKKYHIVTLPPRDFEVYNKEIKSSNLYRVEICRKLINMGCDLKYVPGFGKNQKGKWTMYGPGGIVFPVYDFKGRIVQLRLRCKHSKRDLEYYQSVNKKPPKYKHFSSKNQQLGSACNNIYSIFKPEGNPGVCFITEGEKKGIVIAEKRGALAISLQGVSSYAVLFEKDSEGKTALDYLKEYGIKIIVVCYDADKVMNKYVLQSEEGTIERLKKSDFKIGVADWNPNVAKGIDDLINKGLNPSITMLI